MNEPEQNQPQDAAQTPPATDELADALARAEENLAGWKRAAADYANLQKDAARQREEMAKYACTNLVRDILPALDGFRDAAAHAPKAGPDGAYDAKAVGQWIEGMNLVRTRLESVLNAAGVTAVDETGVKFDPGCREALMVEKPDKPERSGEVLRVLQAGYLMHDRVLRAAKVVVAE